MAAPDPNEIRDALATVGARGLVEDIYSDPVAWLAPLCQLVERERGETRREAVIALNTALAPSLVRFPGESPIETVLPALRAGLGDTSCLFQSLCATEMVGPRAAPLASAVRNLFRSEVPGVRLSAACALARILGSSALESVPVLIQALESERDGEVLCAVCSALCDLGAAASSAEPALRRLLPEATEEYRPALLQAIRAVAA